MFKGKKHERIAHIVRGKRAVRMRDMAKRVREYKEVSSTSIEGKGS